MDIIEIFALAVGLAMDAFAVALSTGMTHKKCGMKQALTMATFFGVFQAAMPLIGWALSSRFKDLMHYNNIIAFVLLAFIGGKMLIEAMKDENEEKNNFSFKTLLALALATSIDAMVAGVVMVKEKIETVSISIAIIGAVAFLFSITGFFLGKRCGVFLKKKAEIFGGLVLIAIGIKMLF